MKLLYSHDWSSRCARASGDDSAWCFPVSCQKRHLELDIHDELLLLNICQQLNALMQQASFNIHVHGEHRGSVWVDTISWLGIVVSSLHGVTPADDTSNTRQMPRESGRIISC